MAINDPSALDALGIEPGTGHALLVIVDDLDWSDPMGHINALQQKVTAYITFAQSEQLERELPEAAGRTRKIGVIQQYEPPENMLPILDGLGQQLMSFGIEFGYGPLPDGYHPD